MRKKDVESRMSGTIRWPTPPRKELLVIIIFLAIDTYLLLQILKELKKRGPDVKDIQPGDKNIGGENKLV